VRACLASGGQTGFTAKQIFLPGTPLGFDALKNSRRVVVREDGLHFGLCQVFLIDCDRNGEHLIGRQPIGGSLCEIAAKQAHFVDCSWLASGLPLQFLFLMCLV
jgi:hypothetical protein